MKIRRKFLDTRGIMAQTGLILKETSPEMELMSKSKRDEKKYTQIYQSDYIPYLLKPKINFKTLSDGTTKPRLSGPSDEPKYMDLTRESGNNFILIVAPAGSGKTFLLRGIVDELHRSGWLVADMCSPKNNFYYSFKPIQDKFRKFLPSWREPNGLPVYPFTAAYIKKPLLKGMKQVQFNVKDVMAEDLITMLKLDERDKQSDLLRSIWIPKGPKNLNELSWKIVNHHKLPIYERFRAKQHPGTIAALNSGIARLAAQDIIGEKYPPINIVDVMAHGKIPSFCLNWSMSDKDPIHSAYIAILLRQIYREVTKKTNRFGRRRVAIVLDDMSIAIPRRRYSSSKTVILNDITRLGREAGVYIFGSVQTLTQIDPEALNQVKLFIFLGEISGEDLNIISRIRKGRYAKLRNFMDDYRDQMKIKDGILEGMRALIYWYSGGKRGLGYVPAPASYQKEER